jgi:membrane protein implicated in regulation of membrane protease activity
MFWWIFGLVIVTILSYLSDVGVIAFMQDWKVPFLNASVLSILILLCLIGLLVRMLRMSKKGEKETLKEKIKELEKKIAELGGK